MTNQDKDNLITRIIQLQLIELESQMNGNKPTIDDKYKDVRSELKLLRCLLFGYNSEFCKIKKGSF